MTRGLSFPPPTVTLHNTETGIQKRVLTNAVGRYVFPVLQPGRYTLRVGQEGFETTSITEFRLAVNQSVTYDVSLSIGATAEEITVDATALVTDTETTELGTAIQNEQVENLPLNGRNFTQLLKLTPGISPISTGQNAGGGSGFAGNAIGSFSFPSVNGQGNRSNMFLIDGLNNYGFVGNYAVAPTVDAIQEFKVQSHNDIAAYGAVIGGIVNVVTAGGTNNYHGTAWEFLRNSNLDARNTFLPGVSEFKQNQFGAVFGGPVVASDSPRTFFFLSYEGFRRVRAAEILSLVPTPAQFSGDLSSLSAQLFDPFSSRLDPSGSGRYLRDPFPNNQIPGGMIDQKLVSYAQGFYPQPTATAIPGVNNIDGTPNKLSQDTGTLRIDHHITDNLTSWGRLIKFDQRGTGATGVGPGTLNTSGLAGQQFGGGATYVFGNGSKVASVRFGRTKVFASSGRQEQDPNAQTSLHRPRWPDRVGQPKFLRFIEF